MQDKKYCFSVGGRVFEGGTHIMAIINVTPDSFFGGSRATADSVVQKVGQSLKDGAEIIDIGGQSMRPGAEMISAEEELARVLPAVEAIKARYPECILSVDTFYSAVARECLSAGADMINDVSCLSDENMAKTVASSKAAIAVMHNRRNSDVADLMADKIAGLNAATSKLLCAGVDGRKMLLDGGIGFNKSREEDVRLINEYGELINSFEYPFMIGTSRKSMFGGRVENRLGHTVRSTAYAKEIGVMFVRVHDVKENAEILRKARL